MVTANAALKARIEDADRRPVLAMSGAGIGDGGERRPTGGTVMSAREGGRSGLGRCGAARGERKGRERWVAGWVSAQLAFPFFFDKTFSFSVFRNNF